MKAVAYYRVSTAAQGKSGLGLEAQRTAVSALVEQRGFTLLAEFTEVESGKRNDRPTLQQALHYARLTNGTLLIAKLDRLSRNAAFLLTLRDSGAKFLAADVPDANDLTIGVLAVIAQAEREAISRRTREALAAIKAKLARGEQHVSKRTGRLVARLGNPNGSRALGDRRASTAAALAARQARANSAADDMRGLIHQIRGEGITSLNGLARSLNERAVKTPRGGRWHASTVANVLRRTLPTQSA